MRGVLLIVCCCGPIVSFAQSGSTKPDSLLSFELSEIVIGSGEKERYRQTEVRRITLADLIQQDALSAADLVRLIPSAYLQTNSRGESLIYLRNAGERQVALFLDGAALNIPWDNRMDLSMIPSGVVGEIEVSRGAPSVLYGTNVIGGAVNLHSRSLDQTGSLFEVQGQSGTQRNRGMQGAVLYRSAVATAFLAGNISSSDGLPISSNANFAFSQSESSVRTNTDRKLASGYFRYTRSLSDVTKLGISFLHTDARKGIAPESHLDPTTQKVRFWRYPTWLNTMLILSAESHMGAATEIRVTAWFGEFKQTIDQYNSALYQVRSKTEEGRDRSAGVRVVSASGLKDGTLRLALNFSTSRHREIITTYSQSKSVSEPSQNFYRQHLYSVGTEYRRSLSSKTSVLAGISFDGALTPETGDKPSRSGMTAAGLNGSLVGELGHDFVLHTSIGRKVRFPTMRELFGDALDTFQINEDLKPESAYMVDIGFEKMSDAVSGGVTFFARRTFDTIDRINIVVDGDKKRRRVNLDGSRVWGVELTGSARLAELITLDGHLIWSSPVAFVDDGRRPMNEKPQLLSTLSIQARSRWGGTIRITSIMTGRAYSLQPDNTQSRLAESLVINIRGALRKYFSPSRIFVEAFAGINNITDQLTLPQLGLPGPGREIHFGISLSR